MVVIPQQWDGRRRSWNEHVGERREPGGIFKCRSAERICRGQMSEAEKFSPAVASGLGVN